MSSKSPFASSIRIGFADQSIAVPSKSGSKARVVAAQFDGQSFQLVPSLSEEARRAALEHVRDFVRSGRRIVAFDQALLDLHLSKLKLAKGSTDGDLPAPLSPSVYGAKFGNAPTLALKRIEALLSKSQATASTSRPPAPKPRAKVGLGSMTPAKPSTSTPISSSARDELVAACRTQANTLTASLWTTAISLAQVRNRESELTGLPFGDFVSSDPSVTIPTARTFADFAESDSLAELAQGILVVDEDEDDEDAEGDEGDDDDDD